MVFGLPGVSYGDVARIEIESVTLEGKPSCVTHAVLVVYLRDGAVLRRKKAYEGVMYETLVDDIKQANRSLAARRDRG